MAEAKKRILEIVDDLECAITINVPIAKEHHRTYEPNSPILHWSLLDSSRSVLEPIRLVSVSSG